MKSYLQLHNAVFNQPHMCTPDYAETVLAVLADRLNLPEGMFEIKQEATKEKLEGISKGVYTLPIRGSMVHHGGMMDSMSGTMSYEGIQDKIQMALDDPTIKSILLDVDSSGGAVAGAFDLADFIAQAKEVKPIYALARDSMCSAAYLISAAATKVYATQTSQVGSIGVVAMHVDQSERNAKEGIKPTFIQAGSYKTAGNGHTALEGEALSYLQESVNDSYDMFVSAVATARGIDPQAIRDTEARVYKGKKAEELGLVDGVRTLGATRKELAGLQGVYPKTLYSTKGPKMENDIDVEKLGADYLVAQADLETTKATLSTLTSAISAEGYTVTESGIEKAQQPEMIEIAGVMTDKHSLPEHVVKALESASADKVEASLAKEALENFPNFSATQGKLLVKMLAGFEGEEKAELGAALASVDKAFGGLMEESGSSDVDGDMGSTSKEKLDAAISEYATEHKMTKAKATTKVLATAEGATLYKQSIKENK